MSRKISRGIKREERSFRTFLSRRRGELLDDLQEAQNGENDGDKEVDANKRTDDTEDDAQNGDLGKQSDYEAADCVNDDKDENLDEQILKGFNAEGKGEILFQSFHVNCLQWIMIGWVTKIEPDFYCNMFLGIVKKDNSTEEKR